MTDEEFQAFDAEIDLCTDMQLLVTLDNTVRIMTNRLACDNPEYWQYVELGHRVVTQMVSLSPVVQNPNAISEEQLRNWSNQWSRDVQ